MKRLTLLPLLALCIASPSLLLATRAINPPAFAYPVDPNVFRISTTYDLDPGDGTMGDYTGWTTDEASITVGHAYDTHNGIDFGAAIGSEVHAVADGTVQALRESVPNNDHSDLGNYLQIDHTVRSQDWRSYFFHLEQDGVVPYATGLQIDKNAVVAYSNNTGNSTGPHLHYSIAPMPSGLTNCPFYKAWWETDEFYWQVDRECMVYLSVDNGPINVYQGDNNSYNVITTISAGTKLVASARNGDYWRVYIPMPPARTLEARTPAGALSSFYSEQGAWADSAAKTTVTDDYYATNRVVPTGLGSRVVEFDDVSTLGQTSTVNYPVTMKGNYDLYVSWPADANAAGVTYSVTDSDGRRDVVVDQKGGSFVDGGDGTKDDPYVIGTNPYVANHTTVGAQSDWDVYTGCGSGQAEAGPENLYTFVLSTAGTVTVNVNTLHSGNDIDIHLLNAAQEDACLYRADTNFTTGMLPAGTYYISADTFGADATKAGPYTLTVTFNNTEPAPNQWYYLGTYWLNDYQDPLVVTTNTGTVTGKVYPGQPGRVYTDSFKLSSKLYRRSGWISYQQSRRIDTNSEATGCVVVNTDSSDGYSRNMFAYASVRVHAKPELTATSEIVGKIVTGQRFICDGRAGDDRDWYRIILTNGTSRTYGWVAGEHLVGYHTADLPTLPDADPAGEFWSFY